MEYLDLSGSSVFLSKPEHYTEVLMAQIRSGSMNSISSDASATQPHFIVCSGPPACFFFPTLRYQRQNAKRHFVCKPESSDSSRMFLNP